jgi:6-phosphogluconolactonase
MTEQVRCADATELAATAAQRVVAASQAAIAERGRFALVLAGGDTPRMLYERLAAAPEGAIDWARTTLFFGDERAVPPDHPESNYRMARESLLAPSAIPAEQVHRIMGEAAPQAAAAQYEAVLREQFTGDWPDFDLVLLGLGDDGHTASLFPGTAALDVTDRWVTANHVPALDAWRITLTLPALNQARELLFLVSGAGKAAALAAVLAPGSDLPAARVQPVQGRVTWCIDADAARHLPAGAG